MGSSRMTTCSSLEIPLGERLDLLVAMLADAELIDHGIDPRLHIRGRNRGKRRKPDQRFLRLPVRIDRHQLRQISNAVLLDERARLEAADENSAACRSQVSKQKRQQGALAGAVWTGNPQHFALGVKTLRPLLPSGRRGNDKFWWRC